MLHVTLTARTALHEPGFSFQEVSYSHEEEGVGLDNPYGPLPT